MKNIYFTLLLSIIFISCGGSESKMIGVYKCADCLYEQIEFQKDEIVEISAGGIKAKGTYELDEKLLTVHTETSDYVFEVVDGNTIVGKEDAKGTYSK
ncbi:MAG: hypothetical protein ACI85I_000560 [Arenicella sp.]|jgi:hypothetical protein